MPINLKDSTGTGYTAVSAANPLPVTIAGGGSSQITTVGALSSGSIVSGFGSIDIGADSLTAGAGSFGTTLLVNRNAVAAPTPSATNILQLVAADSESGNFTLDTFGATPFIYGRRTGGTNASKTATLSGNNLLAISGRGYQAVTFAYSNDAARILFQAAENFTDTAQGANVLIQATAPASTSVATVATFSSTGVSVVGTLTSSGLFGCGGSTPASAAASGTAGTITWDSSYIYVCTATNTWKRVAIATW